MRKWVHAIVWPLVVLVGLWWLSQRLHRDSRHIRDIGVLLDEHGTLSIDDVKERQFEDLGRRPVFPVVRVVWLKMTLPQDELYTDEDTVLFTGTNETLVSVAGFLVEPSETIPLGVCKVEINSPECQTAPLQYAFKVAKSIKPGPRTLLLRIVPGSALITHEFYLMRKSYFDRVTIFITNFVGIASGFCIVITIFAFIFYLAFREKAFLVYSLFCFHLLFINNVNRGIWDVFVSPYIPIRGATLVLPLNFLTLFFDLFFLKTFFTLKLTNPRLNKVYVAFMFTVGMLSAASFYYPILKATWFAALVLIPTVGILTTATLYKFLAEGRKHASLFASAWGVELISYFMWSLYRSGLIEGVWFFGYFTTLGRMIGMVVLMVVIFLKLRELQMRLGFAKAKAEGADVVKTLFRTITHDLSNTTQVIILSGTSLSQEKSAAQFEKTRQRIIRAAETQRDMINHAKKRYLVRGGNIVELSAVDLSQTICAVVESLETRLREKRIKLNLASSGEPLFVLAEDITLANQVLSNLLINAIKFSNPDRQIKIESRTANRSRVECIIEDEGIGMPGEILNRLFDEEKPITRPGTFGEQGTGSGMLIVKEFLLAYGAELEITSTVGVGTKILIRFIRAEAPKTIRPINSALDH